MDDGPLLSRPVALLGCVECLVGFVGAVRIWPLFGIRNDDRGDPVVIARRFFSVVVSSLITVFGLWYLAADRKSFFAQLGFQRDFVKPALVGLALVAILFLGPILQIALEVLEIGPATFVRIHCLPRGRRRRAELLRNIVLSPLSEELIFRSCMCWLLGAAGWSGKWIIFAGPVMFSLAHAHHGYDLLRGGANYKHAAAVVLFQMSYTSIFGMFAAFLLMRTGNFSAPLAAHALCNLMGFPDFSWFSDPSHDMYEYRLRLLSGYVVGLTLFCFLLGPLTSGFRGLARPY